MHENETVPAELVCQFVFSRAVYLFINPGTESLVFPSIGYPSSGKKSQPEKRHSAKEHEAPATRPPAVWKRPLRMGTPFPYACVTVMTPWHTVVLAGVLQKTFTLVGPETRHPRG